MHTLSAAPDAVAPDGSEVRLLLANDAASTAVFRLAPGRTSVAVRHRTVSELWTVIAGSGEIWRSDGAEESIVTLAPGVAVDIPLGTAFQFRSAGEQPLEVLGVTTPPWPGDDEAYPVDGAWVAV